MHYLRVFIWGLLGAFLVLPVYAGIHPNDDGLYSNVLTGKVTDKLTQQPLPGATVYLPDLRVGAAADAQGNYTIKNLPKGTYLVDVHYKNLHRLQERPIWLTCRKIIL